jgi:hypothetical protein
MWVICSGTGNSVQPLGRLYQDVEPEEEMVLELDGECPFRLNAATMFEQR